MENLVSIKLPTGQTIELFSSSGKIVANLMSPAGYGVSHQHLSEAQIDGLRTLVERIEPKPPNNADKYEDKQHT